MGKKNYVLDCIRAGKILDINEYMDYWYEQKLKTELKLSLLDFLGFEEVDYNCLMVNPEYLEQILVRYGLVKRNRFIYFSTYQYLDFKNVKGVKHCTIMHDTIRNAHDLTIFSRVVRDDHFKKYGVRLKELNILYCRKVDDWHE